MEKSTIHRAKSKAKSTQAKHPKGLFVYRLNLASASLYPHPHFAKSPNNLSSKKHIFLVLGLKPLMRHYDRRALSQKDKATLNAHPNLGKNSSFILSRALLQSLKVPKNIIFSYSHKSDIAVLAFARFPIGIDIEIIKNRDFTPHLDFCFSPFERDFIADSPNPLRYFYHLWTLKESLIKLENLKFSDLNRVGLDKKGAFYETTSQASKNPKKNCKNAQKITGNIAREKSKIYHRFCFITRLYKYQKAIITISY